MKRFLFYTIIVFSVGNLAHPSAASEAERRILLTRYETIHALPQSHISDEVVVDSDTANDLLRADIFGIYQRPLAVLARTLGDVGEWCEFMPLNLNIKACTFESTAAGHWLTLYAGRKYYEPPEDAHPLRYHFQVMAQTPTYFRVQLTAAEGPFGTSDYLILVEGMAWQADATLLRIHTSYQDSLRSRLGTNIYLATLGLGKVGFTQNGKAQNGETQFVDGVRGIIERNAMRYFLALRAHLDMQGLPAMQRFTARIQRWFELTEVYARQLHELDWPEYQASKLRERENQARLQAKIPVPG